MFIINLIVLILFTFPICDNYKVYGKSPTNLPAWFWETPFYPDTYFAVGYSRPHRDSPSAFDEAFADASFRLFGDMKGMRIVGEIASVSTPRGMRIVYNTVEIVIDTSGLANFRSKLFRLDSIATPDLRAIILSNMDIPLNNKLTESPKIDGIEFMQTGIEQGFFHHSSSWKSAERHARIEHCFSEAISIKSLTKTWNELMKYFTVNNVDVHINGLQSYNRRYDADLNIFIVRVVKILNK